MIKFVQIDYKYNEVHGGECIVPPMFEGWVPFQVEIRSSNLGSYRHEYLTLAIWLRKEVE